MTERKHRSSKKTLNYKEFNELGHNIPNNGRQDTTAMVETSASEETRSSSAGESTNTSVDTLNDDDSEEIILKQAIIQKIENKSSAQQKTKDGEGERVKHDKQSKQNMQGKTAKHKANNESRLELRKHKAKGSRSRSRSHSTPSATETSLNTSLVSDNAVAVAKQRGNKQNAKRRHEAETEQDDLQLQVDSEEDDIDDDDTNSKSPSKKTKAPNKTPNKTPAKIKGASKTPKKVVNKTPSKKRLSVAGRLTMLPTPTITHNTPYLFNDESFQIENRRAERDREAAEQMLLHSQREAELAKIRLQAEETKRKTMALQKQADRDNKKAEQERARYNQKQTNKTKDNSKNKRRANETETSHREFDASQHNAQDPMERYINEMKHKAKGLNPLRRARMLHTDESGANNPNIAGQDNGHNAWMDMQLNPDNMDQDLRYDSRYAKRNSDMNKMYDIDDIPIRGPQNDTDIASDISIDEATAIANQLMNDENVSICRTSGMMKIKEDDKSRNRRRPVSSTVTRVQANERESQEYGKGPTRGRNKFNNWNRYERSDDETSGIEKPNVGWDTDVEIYSSGEDYNKQQVNFNRNKKQTRNAKQKIGSPNRTLNVNRFDRNGRQGDRHEEQGRSRSRNNTSQANRGTGREEAYRYKGTCQFTDDSSSEEEEESCASAARRIKSGINAKPTSSVKMQLTYPQFSLGQVSGYIGQNVKFHYLTYEQFIAGELTTIITCSDPIEAEGRVQLLQRVSLWRLRSNVSWQQVRQAYAHILRRIENQEIDWTADWDRYEKHIYDRVLPIGGKTEKRRSVTTSSQQDSTWFCKLYQKTEGCNKDSPHMARIGNTTKQVQHICAACWLKDRVKRGHPECSNDCPQKEA